MLHRLPLWMAFLLLAVVSAIHAQTAAPAVPPMPPGQIQAKQVTGRVSVLLNGTTTELKNNEVVPELATVSTAADSSVVLVFSNGASTQLGAGTTLVIEQFLQDPFTAQLSVGDLSEEPTSSQTRLRLATGELIGKVAKLRHDKGSTFTIQTPVGAAGIRGTTFRIVFRPTGSGQAFAFALSTVEGNVILQQAGAQGRGGQGGQAPQGAQPGQGGPGAQPGQAGQPQGGGMLPAGVPVTGGQEVVVLVSVTMNPQTGQVTVTAPPVVASTVPISAQTQAAIVSQAQTMAIAAAGTTFTPTAGSGNPPPSQQSGGQQRSSSEGSNDSGSANENPGAGNSGSNSNSNSGGAGGSGGTGASGNQNSNANGTPPTAPAQPPTPPVPTPPALPLQSSAQPPRLSPVPPVTVPPAALTPLAGKSQ